MRGHSPSSHTGQPLLRTSRYGQTAEAGPRGHRGQPWCGGWEEEASGVTLRSAATTTTPPPDSSGPRGNPGGGKGTASVSRAPPDQLPVLPGLLTLPSLPPRATPEALRGTGSLVPSLASRPGRGALRGEAKDGASSVCTTKVWGSVRGYKLGSHGRSTVMGRRRGGLPPPLCHWRRGIVHTATATESGLGPASLSPGIPEPVSS